MGGVALSDPSQGLLVQMWKAEARGTDVYAIEADNTEHLLFARTNPITEISLTFDQNMSPFVVFVENNQPWFWWYDPNVAAQVFTQMAVDVVSPRCTLDDKRHFASTYSDIILSYIRNRNLYYRLQRERYVTEHLLASSSGDYLYDIGMASNYRLQWVLSR